MKKFIYLIFTGALLASMAACENEPENPGDFNVKSKLDVSRLVSETTGNTYAINIAREVDTTYEYFYNVHDTLKGPDGEPVLGNDGKLQITTTQKSYFSKKTARLVEYEPILLPSYPEHDFDTLALNFTSNAAWNIIELPASVNWYTPLSSMSVGGDGSLKFSIKQWSGDVSRFVVKQEIMTQDSMVMHRFFFKHSGLKYTGK